MHHIVVGLLIGLAVAIAIILLLAAVAVWHRWTFYLHIYDKKFLLELHGFGLRRKLIFRDFTEEPKKTEAENTPNSSEGKTSKNSFLGHWNTAKQRIYDPEKGGYQQGGLREVLDEYRTIFVQSKEVLREFSGNIRHRVQVSSLWIRLDFGTGNPAHTGMLYGWIWSAVGLAYPIISRYIKMAYPTMEITPDFYKPRFDLEVKSIIKVRPAHIMNALLKQFWRPAITYCYQNFTKGSVKND